MSRRLLTFCLLTIGLLLAVGGGLFTSVGNRKACAAEVSSAQQQSRNQRPRNTSYRRLFVPADSPETWPVGSERYLPLPHAEFSRLVQPLRPDSASQQQLPIRVSHAVYRARLVSDNVLEGTAEWTVELAKDQTPAKAAGLLPLSPLNLAIQSARWQRDPARAAAIGLWKRDDNVMDLAVMTKQSDTLQFEWQVAAKRNDSARAEFALQMPIVVPQTFELELPASRSATLSAGEVLEKSVIGPLGERRWVFQLAPAEIHRLQISQLAPTQATRSQPLVSQATSYQLEPSGLTVVTQLRLDARESPLTELKAVITSGLRVVEVNIDQQPVAWRVSTIAGDNTLIIPRPESMQPQTVEIRCLAKFRSDTTWQLPKFRFDEVAWTDGTTSLLVSPDLELRLLTPRQATLQHIVGIADNARAGEVFRLQEWSREATLEIEVGRPQPKFSARTATTIEVGRDEAKANIATELLSSGRDIYQVQATVAAGWSIDSVTTTPKTALNDWHIDRDETTSKIRFQLNQPISKRNGLRVEIKARETTSKSVLPATVGELKILRFQGADVNHNLLHLRTRKSEQYVLAERLERSLLSPDGLSSAWSTLLPKSPVGALLDVSQLDDAEIVEFRQQPAQYQAHVQIEIDALPGSLEHHYQIDCQLHSGSVSEIVLELDEPLPEAFHWNFVGQRGIITSERIDAALSTETPPTPPSNGAKESALDDSPKSTAKYRLRFPKGMTDDFRLRASYSQPGQPLVRCNLIRLPQSVDWDGQVLLHGALEGFHVLDQGWTPTVYSNIEVDKERLPVLGVYRLGADEFRRGSATARLRLQRHRGEQSAAPLIAWLAEYRTMQAANGSAIHSASYSLENLGTAEAKIVLPEEAELQEAWLDNKPLEPMLLASEGHVYRLRFGEDQRWPYLILKYSTRVPPLRGAAFIQPVVPDCSFPVSRSRWTLWAPEQYEIDNAKQNYSSQRYHWWKRIFGPLSRSRGETVFNPVRGASWSELWSAPLVGQQTKQVAERLASRLVDRLEIDPNQLVGNLLTDLIEKNQIAELFYVDRSALLAMGIQSRTSCQALIDVSLPMRSRSALALPLSSYRLAFVVSPGMIALTTAERVAHWYDQLRPTELSGVFMVSSDDLAESFDKIRSSRTSEIMTVAQWKGTPLMESPAWVGHSAEELADIGRRAQTVEFVEQLPTLTVRPAFVQRALWYAVFLLTIVLGVWQLAHYPNGMILGSAIAGAACLLAPASWLTIPQAVFLGLVAAAIVRVAMRSSQLKNVRSQMVRRATAATIGCYLYFLGSLVHAQPGIPQDATAGMKKDLPRVLLPIDAQGNRQGNDIYLSEEFLTTLRQSRRHVANDGAELVLLAATYRGSLVGSSEGHSEGEPKGEPEDEPERESEGESREAAPATNESVTGPWTFRWKVESFLPNCRFVLPLRREEAIWDEQAHRLDGVPIKIDWQPRGNGCSVLLPTPGVHWLQLVGQPRFTTKDRIARLGLHIPPLSGAVLDLTLAPSVDHLLVPGAVRRRPGGQTTIPDARDQQHYVLGGGRDTLELRWAWKGANSSTASWERLEQRSWLHVDPAAARFDVQLSLSGLQAPALLLELNVPVQLKLVSPGDDSPVAEVIYPSPSDPTRLQLKLRPGLPADLVLPLRFELQRSVSVGNIFLPTVRLQGSAPDENLVAVSIAAGLSYDEKVSINVRQIEPADFSASWDNADEEPLYSYALGQEDPKWSLRIWPDPQSLAAQQTLRIQCLPRQARFDFKAAIDALSGSWLTHRLQVPRSLQIDSITVHSQVESNSVPVRWSRVSETEEVVVFLGRPLQQPHLLTLQGHVDATSGGEVELPQVQLLGGERSKIHMDLFRTDNVHVSWVDPELVPEEIQQQRVPRNVDELPIGHFSWRSSDTGKLSRLRIEINNPGFETSSVTTVDLSLDVWTACLNSRVTIRQGIVSRMILTVPNNFRAPYGLLTKQVGNIAEEVRETPSGKEITLLLAEPATAGDEIEVRINGVLSLPADRHLVIPSLQWKGATGRDRFVLLPTLIDGESIEWQQPSGLKRQALPQSLSAYAPQQEAAISFHIEQNQFEAEERSYRGTMRNALVRYGKVSATVDEAGLLTATAELVLQPGRATSCEIQLPPQSQLCQLIVGDLPVRREQLENTRWKVPLGPPFMPQRIVVNYRSEHELGGQRLQLAAPKIFLGDQSLPAAQTWWRIRRTNGLQLSEPKVGRRVDAIEFAQETLRLALLVWKDALSPALELPRMEGRSWLQTWQNVTREANVDWQAYDLSETEQSELSVAETARLRFVEAFAADDPAAATRQSPLVYPPRFPLSPDASPTGNELFFTSDAQGQLALHATPSSEKTLWRWIAAIAWVCGILAVVSRLRHNPQWHHELCHWPHVLAMGGGFVWWLLLRPSAIGMLVIALTLTSLALRQWRHFRHHRQHDPATQLVLPTS